MSFFENVGKKITDMSQSTIQKGKDFADVSKLNAKIAEEERKIKANYAEIGKAYMENYREEPDELFAGFVQAIIDSENLIAEHKNKIEEIKTAEKCPSCGAMVKADSEFCTACGKPMVLPQTDKTTQQDVMCECGNMIPRGTRFCTKCGKLAQVLVQNTYSAQAPVQSVVMENMNEVPMNQGMQQNPYGVMNQGMQQNPYGVMNQGMQQNPYGAMNQGMQQNPYGAMNQGMQQNPYATMNQGMQQNPYTAMNQGMQQNPYGAMNSGAQQNPYKATNDMNQGMQQDYYEPVNQAAPISPFVPMPVAPVETTAMSENCQMDQEVISQEEASLYTEEVSETQGLDTAPSVEEQVNPENRWNSVDSYEYQGV